MRVLLTDAADADSLTAAGAITSVARLSGRVLGLVYRCRRGHYHVIAADWLTDEQRRWLFWHEAWHILHDCEGDGQTVGSDPAGEAAADRFADERVR